MNFPFPLRISQERRSCRFLERKEGSLKPALLDMVPGSQGDKSSEEVQTLSNFRDLAGDSEGTDLWILSIMVSLWDSRSESSWICSFIRYFQMCLKHQALWWVFWKCEGWSGVLSLPEIYNWWRYKFSEKKISSGEEIQETPKEVLRAKKMNNQRPRN